MSMLDSNDSQFKLIGIKHLVSFMYCMYHSSDNL
jgi:hypothetical protein